MKKVFQYAVALLIIVSFSFTCFPKDLRIGYVDMIKVFNDYQKTKDYESELDARKKEVEGKLNKKKEEIEKLNNKMSVLKDKEKEEQQNKIQEKVKEYRDIGRGAEVDMRKIVIEQMTEIKEDIDKIVKDYAKKKGFNLIVDGNSVLHADKAMDVTKDILNISNKQYKRKK